MVPLGAAAWRKFVQIVEQSPTRRQSRLETTRLSMKRLRIPALVMIAVAVGALPACNQGSSPQPGKGECNSFGKYTLHSTKYDNVDSNKAKDNAADVLTQLQNEEL